MHGRRARGEGSVGELLFQVSRLVGDSMRVKMEEIGLHRAQGFALGFLWHHEGVPQSELARALYLSPASVTNMLQRMERDGWVERRQDPEDQRVSRVYLTDRARALREEAEATFGKLEQEVTSALTPTEQTELRALLAKVRARLVEHLPPRKHGGFPAGREGGEEP